MSTSCEVPRSKKGQQQSNNQKEFVSLLIESLRTTFLKPVSVFRYVIYHWLGGLRVTNPPIRLMCPTSACLSVHIFSLLANGRKLMAWPGIVFVVVVVVNNFFQPLLLRNYCTDFFEIWYGASLGRGLSFFRIACFSTNQRRSHDQKHVFQKGVLVWMIT